MALPAATRRLLATAADGGIVLEPVAFPEGTKTAGDAAAAIGCEVAQIVKSLVFVADDDPVLVLMPGDLRLDTARLAAATHTEEVRRATLDEVRAATGFAAGGTPPFGHIRPIPTYAERALRRHTQLWAAAGTPTTVFPIGVDDLDRMAGPIWADLAEGG